MASAPTEASRRLDAGVLADNPPAVAESNEHTDDQIRERAYLIWLNEGQPEGRELDHWLRANWELGHERD